MNQKMAFLRMRIGVVWGCVGVGVGTVAKRDVGKPLH